jgi:putative membrane protein
MVSLILRVLINAGALLLAAHLIPGITVANAGSAIIAAVILGLLNAIVRPVLLILTFPITVVTLGLFAFVINALLFWFAAVFVAGFAVNGFFAALLGSVFVSLVATLGSKFLR